MVIGIMLGAGAVVVLWALYKAVIYATPLAAGVVVTMQSYSLGVGWLAAAVLGLVCAFGAFPLLRLLASQTTTTALRYAVAAAFAVPATWLAYGIAIDVVGEHLPAPLWTQSIAIGFATLAGVISCKRLLEYDMQ